MLTEKPAATAEQTGAEGYRALFDSSRDGIVIVSLEGRIEDANRSFLDMLGYSREDLAKLDYRSLSPASWVQRDAEIVSEQVLKRGCSEDYEKAYLRRDGSLLPVSVRVWLVRDAAGRPSHLWRIARDVSERRRMEESLRASERRLLMVLEKLPVGVWLTDAQGQVVLCNPEGERIWGGACFTDVEQYGRCAGWWHGTGRRLQPHEWAPVRALSRGETYVNELIDIETSGGARKTVAHSAIPLRDDAGCIAGIILINEDVTERVRAQERLRASEERHRQITQALSDYVYTVWVKDGQVESTEHGAACEAVTGYTRDDFSFSPYLWLRMVVEDDRAAVLEQGRRLLAGEPAASIEHRIVRKDNQVRWVRNTPVTHRDSQGRLLCYDGVIQDITDRHQAEGSLRLAQFALDHCSIPVFWIGPQGRFLYTNEAAARSLDHPREHLLYLGLPDVNSDLSVESWPARWAEIKALKVSRFESRQRARDGRIFPVEITANYMEVGGQEWCLAFVQERTEGRRLEEKLVG